MKILLLGEYSGLHNELKKSLIQQGHDVTLAASDDFFKKFPSDINLGSGKNIYSYKISQLLKPFLNLNKLVGFDVVHIINFYIFPRSPLLNLFLVRFLKKNNRIITLSGAGDDPFFVNYAQKCLRYNPIESHEKIDRKSEYYMRKTSHLEYMHRFMEYIDAVIPIMYEYYSTFLYAGYTKKTFKPIPIPIDTKSINYIPNIVTNKPIVFHGLNRPGFKGTHIIEAAFNKLDPKKIKCFIKGKMPFKQYLSLMQKININIDQVFSYSLSMNSLYSMAQGKITLGGNEPESRILYNNEIPPAINILPEASNIIEKIEQVVSKNNFLLEGEKSRNFIEKYHNPTVIAQQYLNIWEKL